MTKRDELAAWLAELPDAVVDALHAEAARLRVTMAPAEGGLDGESRSWLDAELTPALEPEDWSGVPKGKPVVWDDTQQAFVVVGGKD
jgi:hypothetical protein